MQCSESGSSEIRILLALLDPDTYIIYGTDPYPYIIVYGTDPDPYIIYGTDPDPYIINGTDLDPVALKLIKNICTFILFVFNF